ESLPDQLVKTGLDASQETSQVLGPTIDGRRPYRLVRLLRQSSPCRVRARRLTDKFLAVTLHDVAARLTDSVLRHDRRVSSHVGDKTDLFAVGDLDALVELLRHHHRALGGVDELAVRFLLQ